MKWVEKSSIEKIRRLLEISERERHCEVLLTSENISAVISNPTPYTLPAIPRPLPSNVVEGEHLVIADLRRLASSSASSSRDLEEEERVESMTGLLDSYAARKRKRQVSSSGESDAAPAGPSQPVADDKPAAD